MPYSLPDLTPSQERSAAEVASAVLSGRHVSIQGPSGAGRSTVLRAAAGRVAAEAGSPTAVLDAQTLNRLAWGVIRRTNGRRNRAHELTTEGVTLFLDDAECLIRVREDDAVVVVGEYAADAIVMIEPWSIEDAEVAVPRLVGQVAASNADRLADVLTPRFLTIADACQNLGLAGDRSLLQTRIEILIIELLEYLEAEAPLAIDLLFAAGEVGTLPVESGWFVDWNGVSQDACEDVVRRLRDVGLIDPHGVGAWRAPAIVRRVIRRQMTPGLRKAASVSLARRLLEISEADVIGVLPHLTTLWNRLSGTGQEIVGQLQSVIEPAWASLGFVLPNAAADHKAGDVQTLVNEARTRREFGATSQAEALLAAAARQTGGDQRDRDDVAFYAKLEYAEIRLRGPHREEAVAELRTLAHADRVRQDVRLRYRIETALASALFYEGRYATAATSFITLADIAPDTTSRAKAWNNAGEAYRAIGRHDEAEGMLRRAVDAFEETGAGRNSTALSARFNLAGVLADRGYDEDALEHFAFVATCREETLGIDAVPTQVARLSWALSLCHVGRHVEAGQIVDRYVPGTGDESLQHAFELVRSRVDAANGRVVKAELRLLRLAEQDFALPSLAVEHHVQIARLYFREGRVDEMRRWAQLASEAVDGIARMAPAQQARVEAVCCLAAAVAGRWDEAGARAAQPSHVASECGASVAPTLSELELVAVLACPPEATAWRSLEAAVRSWLARRRCRFVPDAIFARIAEAGVAQEVPDQVAGLLDDLLEHAAPPSRQALVVRASLAVLLAEKDAVGRWEQVLDVTPPSMTDAREAAERVIEELRRNEAPGEDLAIGEVTIETLLARSRMEFGIDRQERNAGHQEVSNLEPVDEGAPSDVSEASEHESGHALDDLF